MKVHVIELKETLFDHDLRNGKIFRMRAWKNTPLTPYLSKNPSEIPPTSEDIKEFEIIEWHVKNRISLTYFGIERTQFGIFNKLAEMTMYEFKRRIEDEIDMARCRWMHEKDVEFSLRQTGIEKVERERIRRLSWWDRLMGNF